MIRTANRFAKGSGVYTCRCCERRTRDTGGDGSSVGLCDQCYELSGYENAIEDGNDSELSKRSMQTIIDYVREVYARGGNRVWDHLLERVIKICKEREEV